ncbi:MotE family protein [uncultured Sulfitobacter sp.]|uniref:MotE family protein n=1 Tax=Sulfitobacter sp. SH22 TaxID=3421172 RepID=UPI0025D3CFDB|nr:hypothetical protein [uncultured Sulfitobacter sp.]
MIKLLNGKLILGGLAVTLCAKAAFSFPLLPLFKDAEIQNPPMVIQTAAVKEDAAAVPQEDAPPLVSGLEEKETTCTAPEEVLLSLNRERDLVAQQKDEIQNQMAELALAQESLLVELASLTELKTSIEELLGKVEAAQTDDLNRLIDLYSNMKPTDAARIMDDMDIETTIMVLGNMRPRTAAPILAKIPAVRARAVSKIILERSQLPGDQDLVGIKLK